MKNSVSIWNSSDENEKGISFQSFSVYIAIAYQDNCH